MKKIVLLLVLVLSVSSFSVTKKMKLKETKGIGGEILYYDSISKRTGVDNLIEKILEKAISLGIEGKVTVNTGEEKYLKGYDEEIVLQSERGRLFTKMLKKTNETDNISLVLLAEISRHKIESKETFGNGVYDGIGYFDYETESPWDLTGKTTAFQTSNPVQYISKNKALYVRDGKSLIVTFKTNVKENDVIAVLFGEPTNYTTVLGVKKFAATAYEL